MSTVVDRGAENPAPQRQYVLIRGDGSAYTYDGALVRLACVPYDEKSRDPRVHITNKFVQTGWEARSVEGRTLDDIERLAEDWCAARPRHSSCSGPGSDHRGDPKITLSALALTSACRRVFPVRLATGRHTPACSKLRSCRSLLTWPTRSPHWSPPACAQRSRRVRRIAPRTLSSLHAIWSSQRRAEST
eukprot:3416209-Prymnesium_polylepis.2